MYNSLKAERSWKVVFWLILHMWLGWWLSFYFTNPFLVLMWRKFPFALLIRQKKKNNKRVLYVHKSIDSFKVFRWKWQQKKHIIVQNIFLQFKNYVKCLKTSFWILKKHDTHVMIWEGCLNLLILIFVFQEIML